MSLEFLRNALATVSGLAEQSREAGQGFWTLYAQELEETNANIQLSVEEFDIGHTMVTTALEGIRPLSKKEKSSLASAKCVIRSAVGRGVDIWRRDAGSRRTVAGRPIPKGKSELQATVSLATYLTKTCTAMLKRMTADDAEALTLTECNAVSEALVPFLAAYEAQVKVAV